MSTADRTALPQLTGAVFLTDGGLETSLIFLDGFELPDFSAFPLLRRPAGREALVRYYERYIAIAKADGVGFILESPTWRASMDWGARRGYDQNEIADANRDAVSLMHELKARHAGGATPMVVSGCIGPRGDGYDPGRVMSADEAQSYHATQTRVLDDAGADMATAITMTNVNEAIGVTRAAQDLRLPVVISFTVETDGRLPTGQSLGDAVNAVDLATGAAPAYYMINCAHPTHFAGTLASDAAWTRRIRGVRANASRSSHQELDNAQDLDEGDPIELGGQYRDLVQAHPDINVLGGCCGTDHRHVESISLACRLRSRSSPRSSSS
jgi:S-methylmethionine-dependent homocysteine/selenocysteine methylase